MKSLQHAHKYLRRKLGKKGFTVFMCLRDGCTHYIREELVIGKLAQCWRCGKEFHITQKSAMLKKPHCISCTRPYGEPPTPGVPIEHPDELVARVLKRLGGGNG